MKIILLGPPGSGKGTQGDLLAAKYDIQRLSIGALLRREIADKSPMGKRMEEIVRHGYNVPGDILRHVLIRWLTEQINGFIIDNFPRSLDQLTLCQALVNEGYLKIDKVFHLTVSEDTSVNRLLKRQHERAERGINRIDETPETIHSRYETGYIHDIDAILTYFKSLGVLVPINGEQPVESVHAQIVSHLEQ